MFTDQFTVDAWAHPKKVTSYSYFQAILEDDDSMHPAVGRGMGLGFTGGVGFWWGEVWVPNPFQVLAYINTTNVEQFLVGAITNPNEMHHYASTYDGTELCVYIDGVQQSCVPANGDLYDNNQNFLIAGNQEIPDGNRYFEGEIDEVEIFDRALAAVEIQAIYDAGSAGKCKVYTPPVPSLSPFAMAMLCSLLGFAGYRRIHR